MTQSRQARPSAAGIATAIGITRNAPAHDDLPDPSRRGAYPTADRNAWTGSIPNACGRLVAEERPLA